MVSSIYTITLASYPKERQKKCVFFSDGTIPEALSKKTLIFVCVIKREKKIILFPPLMFSATNKVFCVFMGANCTHTQKISFFLVVELRSVYADVSGSNFILFFSSFFSVDKKKQ